MKAVNFSFSRDTVVKGPEYRSEGEAVSMLIEAVKRQAAAMLDEHLVSLFRSINDHENSRLLGAREDEEYDVDEPLGQYPELLHVYPENGGQRRQRTTALNLLSCRWNGNGGIVGSEFINHLRAYWLPLYELEAVERLAEDLNNGTIKIRPY